MATTGNRDFRNVIHCSLLREDDENVWLQGDDGIEYQVSKSSVDMENLPCTIQGNDDSGDPVLFVVNSDNNKETEEVPMHATTIRWNDSNTRLLLEWYLELKNKVVMNIIPTYRRMWEEMAARFGESGFDFTAEQVENRWKTLDRRYRKALKQPARRPITYMYFKEIKEIQNHFSNPSPDVWTCAPNFNLSDGDMDLEENSIPAPMPTSTNSRPVNSKKGTPNEKGLKVKGVSHELASLRSAILLRQQRRDALAEVRERNRILRHKEEMDILAGIVQALTEKTKTSASPILPTSEANDPN